jgi:hypothetical protein
MSKLILEAIARHRAISLSQAVEYLITDAGSRYKIGEQPIIDTVTQALRDFAMTAPDGSPINEDLDNFIALSERLNEHIKRFSRSEFGRLLLFPDELLSPEEKFFVRVVRHPEFPNMSVSGVDHYMEVVLRTYKPSWEEDDVIEVVNIIKEDFEKKTATKEIKKAKK